MLFDISGRRHTVVRAVYGGLAVVFLAGFIGFGVGSDVSGGLFGSGHGGFHHNGVAASLDDQRDRLRRLVETHPDDARSWRQLSLLEAEAAYEPSSHHGAVLAPHGRSRLVESTIAYERYRDLVGRRHVDRVVGQTAGRSYAALGMLRDAIDANWLVTGRSDVAGHFLVAQLAAAAGDDKLVEQAMSRAIANASPSQRRALRSQLPALRQRSATVPGRLSEATPPGPGA